MKKILYLVAIVLVSFTSCNDFLDEKLRSEREVENAFLSANDGYSAVNALYRSGVAEFHTAGSAYVGPYIFYGDYRTGLFENDYSGQHNFNTSLFNLSVDSEKDNGELSQIWKKLYATISSKVNFTLAGLEICPGLTDEERARLIAEAKFFRALNYFYLVKNFGAVPIVTKHYKEISNDMFVHRSTVKSVYDFIVNDLTTALNDGGLPDLSMPRNEMRITKGSVNALLADVYLNMAGYPLNDVSKYGEAAKIAKSFIGNSQYALINGKNNGAESTYNILRTSDEETEYLYQVQYQQEIANGGWYPAYCFPVNWAAANPKTIAYDITCCVNNPALKLQDIYDATDDLRIQEGQYFHSIYKGIPLELDANKVPTGRKFPFFYAEAAALDQLGKTSKDQVMYRAAEMYLIFAEADVVAQGSVTVEAVEALAIIQARASLNQSLNDIKTKLMALSKDKFIEEVWNEKLREFMFEHKAWNDITRTRKYPDINNNFNYVDVIGAKTIFNKTFVEKDMTYPYPFNEIQRNPKLMDEPIEGLEESQK